MLVRNTGVRRLLAFFIDWLLIVAWGALVLGAVLLLFGGVPPRPAGPWGMQLVSFGLMTVPVVLYFALAESSAWQASVGKHLLGLRVVGASGARAPFPHTLLRNGIRFVPWMLGHTVALQAAFSTRTTPPAWVYVPMLLSAVGVVWWLISILLFVRTPYDVLSRTCVTRMRALPARGVP